MNERTITIESNGSKKVYKTRSAHQTHLLAQKIFKELRGGDVLALSGDLGAGKTTFVQGLAKALGIAEQITSPTFVLMKIYALPKPINNITQLCHIDAYRLSSSAELAAIGAVEYIGDAHTLTAVEWPERVSKLIPKNAIVFTFHLFT
ncbi:tRNA (adenosine(37)-N6)-threonylcarbamoyltransferase complex ATPase subunit type 1 TsaE [Candidatus Uhrbacteria bacterium]|nr:tRNA (adenosine(37)-N6)-threonylcarbamoyltransferase complex ATPase subunit type 1 TsaE [Candidatus Uhrbacteria bacterium]